MQQITHFCLIHHPIVAEVDLVGMKPVLLPSGVAGSCALFVCFKDGDSTTVIDNGLYSIGYAHQNGDGLNLKIKIDGRHFTCQADVISGIPVFICQRDEGIVISSSLAVLIRACRQIGIQLELDLGACSEMMLASYVFSRERTLVKGVERLLPNHEVRVDLHRGKVTSVRIAEDFAYAEKPASWQWCVEHLRESIVSGLKRYTGKRVAVMLSGGADSRVTAVCAVEAGLEPDFFTFGQSTVNASDFPIASVVAHRLGRPIKAFSATADHFRNNWKTIAQKSNWTDMWNLAKLPQGFFEQLSEYDVVLRGDGDGIYGWKKPVGNVSDILHRLEISPMAAALKCADWFEEPRDVFSPGEESRNCIIAEYAGYTGSLIDLENVLYQRHREYGSIAQNIWLLSNWMTCDAPLLWSNSIEVASKIPKNRRTNKQVIFALLDTFIQLKDVPFSSGGSWNDLLENWFSGVSEDLIDYVARWSPWPVHREQLRAVYGTPPPVPEDLRQTLNPVGTIKACLQQQNWVRRYVLNRHPEWVHSSFCDRGLTRLAVISNLREFLKNEQVG